MRQLNDKYPLQSRNHNWWGGRSKVQLQQIHAETQFSTQTKKQKKNGKEKCIKEYKEKFNKSDYVAEL